MLLIIGFLFMVFILAVVSILTGVGTVFVDLPSALLVLVSLIFFWLVSKSGKVIGSYIKTSLKKEHVYTAAELVSLSTALKNTIKFNYLVGGFGFFVGVIAALAFLGSPENIGPNFAIALITVLYPVMINGFVFFPVQAWAENKIAALKNEA